MKQKNVPGKIAKNTPIKGAGFTTTNTGVDGTGHCKNGNEDINCNLYDGKQYVWLNGGPATAYVGDGDYFFAVLEPGGQSDPNDGGAKNLSDGANGAYTTRTFSVSGGIVTYAKPPGTHDLDGNKIRLLPYDDTGNPGGVYIMAICSLADGYPVNPSDCKYDAFKVGETPIVQAAALTTDKNANGAYDKTYAWTIAKAVDKTTVTQTGGNVTFTYTVTVTHDAGTISGIKVTGKINVYNTNLDASNNVLPVAIDGISDQLSNGTVCTVTNGGPQTLIAAQTIFDYSCAISGTTVPSSLNNTVTVTWSTQLLDDGKLLSGSSANYTFTGITFAENAIDETITVTDSYAGTLGTVTVGVDPNPKTFTYTRTIAVVAGCVTYNNTATFTTNDTGATGTASQSVTVCGPTSTGALTMGFWKGPNGNSLIQNYCRPSAGTSSLAYWLSHLGGSTSGPFGAAATLTTCSALVSYTNGIFNAASATDMNKMLKAQMLATALDVYFSTTGLGWSTTAIGKIKAPSNFLKNGIGTFNMDMTKICPMVDNTVAGTAACKNLTPSTNAFASGVVPAAAMTVQALLDYAATTPTPFNAGVWFAGDRTKQEVLKNIFDQINNDVAFAAP